MNAQEHHHKFMILSFRSF